MPSGGGGDGLSAAIVLGDELAGARFAVGAGGELGAVLAANEQSDRRAGGEFVGLDVAAAGDAVNVPLVVAVGARFLLRFALALGQSLFSPHCGRESRRGARRRSSAMRGRAVLSACRARPAG